MDLIGTLWEVAEKVDSVMLSPIRFAHSSTSLTVPERSRREGRLFACHSAPDAVNRGKNPSRRLRDHQGMPPGVYPQRGMQGILRFAQNDNPAHSFKSFLGG